jgi:hypothetical protein
MFLIKQVLPIVILSMVIGFAVTWYNWRSSDQAEGKGAVESANNSSTAEKSALTKSILPPVKQQVSKPAIKAQSKSTTVPMRVVKPPRSEPKPVQRTSRVDSAATNSPPVIQKPAVAKLTTPVVDIVDASKPDTDRNQKADPNFVSSIESEINGLNSTAKPVNEPPVPDVQKQPANTNSEMSGWSANKFMDVMKQENAPVAAPQDEIASVISRAAKRNEQQAPKDPYLSSLQDEATDLSVTAVKIAGNTDITRNQPYDSASSKLIHIVKQGDSLTSISNEVYGDPNAYLRIYNANKDVLTSPDQLTEGVSLRIP